MSYQVMWANLKGLAGKTAVILEGLDTIYFLFKIHTYIYIYQVYLSNCLYRSKLYPSPSNPSWAINHKKTYQSIKYYIKLDIKHQIKSNAKHHMKIDIKHHQQITNIHR